MCNPEGFAVDYEINPWMHHQIGCVAPDLARSQWQALHDGLAEHAEVRVMAGDRAWPDLVFTANAGLPLPAEKKFVLANFRHPQRQGEQAIDAAWFAAAGWHCLTLPAEAVFEGAGDALFDGQGRLWLGDGPRSSAVTGDCLRDLVDAEVVRLKLVDPAYYHLDTCFCPLPGGYALHVPGAFDDASRTRLAGAFGKRLIALSADEGRMFAANAVCVGNAIFLNCASDRLIGLLAECGFTVIATPLSEFLKAGGGAKCLTLSLAGWAYRN
jgi:N-dimethylarginine dimethylaminohydrolase